MSLPNNRIEIGFHEIRGIPKDELDTLKDKLGNKYEYRLTTMHYIYTNQDTNEIKHLGPLSYIRIVNNEEYNGMFSPELYADIWNALLWYSFGFEIQFNILIVGKGLVDRKIRKSENYDFPPPWDEDNWWKDRSTRAIKIFENGTENHYNALMLLFKIYKMRIPLMGDHNKGFILDDKFSLYYRALENIAKLIEPDKNNHIAVNKTLYTLLKSEKFNEAEVEEVRKYRNDIMHGKKVANSHEFFKIENKLMVATRNIVKKAIEQII